MKKLFFVRLILILTVIAVAVLLSGFADKFTGSEIYTLLHKRTAVIQRYMFDGSKDKDVLFKGLSEIETYPALSDDFRNASEYINSDCDKVINMKLINADILYSARDYAVYDITVKWYMSGDCGYYIEVCDYRVRTSIINNISYLAEISPMQYTS